MKFTVAFQNIAWIGFQTMILFISCTRYDFKFVNIVLFFIILTLSIVIDKLQTHSILFVLITLQFLLQIGA